MTHRRAAILIVVLTGFSACGAAPEADYTYWLARFRRATPVPTSTEGTGWAWSLDVFDLSWDKPNVTVSVRGRSDEPVRIRFSDEPEHRTVADSSGFGKVVEIRFNHSTLYACWEVSRNTTAYEIAAYDLRNRQVLIRWRVKPADVPMIRNTAG